ncbi:hypothetical protein KP509_21G046600 [Ceratopteris richardii]|uniref:Serine hydroxymethyltransferase n=1 Tax=Ceratopteris richardii TaxID=49495 RepID=A0A8T2SBM7_CERRI|nr:hypothetical protein KP509_21G046600 [Ceratopteris richardii]
MQFGARDLVSLALTNQDLNCSSQHASPRSDMETSDLNQQFLQGGSASTMSGNGHSSSFSVNGRPSSPHLHGVPSKIACINGHSDSSLPFQPIPLHVTQPGGSNAQHDPNIGVLLREGTIQASEHMHVSKKSRKDPQPYHTFLPQHSSHAQCPESAHSAAGPSPQSPIQKPIACVNPPATSSWNGILNGPQATQSHAHLGALSVNSSRPSAFYNPAQSADLAARRLSVQSWGNKQLPHVDPHLWVIMEKEKQRQCKTIELVASENYTSQAVIEALGSHLTNKYSEGMPGARLYCGNENIDLIENLCIERALKAFHLDASMWGVNVQPYSCTSANFAVYTALLQPKDRIMGLDSPSGGHLSHGYYTPSRKKVSGASIYFETFPYRVDSSGYIDFVDLERIALAYRPKLLICGASAYPREWDYSLFRDIADRCGAILMCDMAHISGIVAAEQCNNPFEYCDIVTSTTHKSLRGPRGGIIFFRRGRKGNKSAGDDVIHYDYEAKINFAVSHATQGGPHNNRTAALAVAFLQVDTPEFKAYICQVLRNAKSLAAALQKKDCKMVTGGTDNHLMLWDLRPFKLTGLHFEKVCEKCGIILNKNALFGDSGGMAPGGVRMGTPAMTSRGCVEEDFEMIAEFLYSALQIALKVKKEHGPSQKAFLKGLQDNQEIEELRARVESFALSFEMPGLVKGT